MCEGKKKNILFVDDEEQILEALRDLLRKQRNKWNMHFTLGGYEAVKILKEKEFDVIVTDMRMPGMDGAELLQHVHDNYPNTVRIVLSGHTELETALRAVPVAHQFLTKPCESHILENVVERACNLQSLLDDKAIQAIIGELQSLPSLPKVYLDLTQALTNPDVTMQEIAEIAQQDMGMCVKILQIVNSAFFGLAQRITSIERAISYLGIKMVKNLAASIQVLQVEKLPDPMVASALQGLQNHSLTVGRIAMDMQDNKELAEDAFMAGMLHDVGKLILATRIPEDYKTIIERVHASNKIYSDVELEVKGITHAEIGGFLLGLWGLPYPVVEAVANHHNPKRVDQQEFDLVATIYIANALTHELKNDDYSIDIEYLKQFGVEERLPKWREIAKKHAGKSLDKNS